MFAQPHAASGTFCLLSLDRLSREGAFHTLRYLTRLSELGISYRSYTEEYINSTASSAT